MTQNDAGSKSGKCIRFVRPCWRELQRMLVGACRSHISASRALLGRRFGSQAAQQTRIARYYQESGDSIEQSADLAEQAFRWLKEGSVLRARKRTANCGWESIFEEMVDDLVVKHKPIAYILGEHSRTHHTAHLADSRCN